MALPQVHSISVARSKMWPNGNEVKETESRELWSKLPPQSINTSSIDQELLDRLSKEFPPATFDATEKHRLEVLESSMMQYPRDECIHRLTPVILEFWQYYLGAIHNEFLWTKLYLDIEKLQQKLQQSQVDRLQLMGELKDTADRNADFKRWFQKLTSKHTDLESRLHEATDRKRA
ncbi:hypothetical protein MVEG_06132 [Podila verticillata NRRL 6337]|nr:hypothetical protein MVEG_06132 [Podila verticillata NRRL 6337]